MAAQQLPHQAHYVRLEVALVEHGVQHAGTECPTSHKLGLEEVVQVVSSLALGRHSGREEGLSVVKETELQVQRTTCCVREEGGDTVGGRREEGGCTHVCMLLQLQQHTYTCTCVHAHM